MPSPEAGAYRPKSHEDLRIQLDDSETVVDPRHKELLIPPSASEDDILAMPLSELKQKYARRYEMYVRILRNLRHPNTGEELATITEDEILSMRKWLRALNSLDTYIQNHHKDESERTLRGKQVDVFEDLRNFLEAGGKSGYVKLPTGFGKTVLFIEFIKALNLRTLIVVPTKLLITQTGDKMSQFAPDLEVGEVYQKAKEFDRQVTVITYSSLIAQLKSGNLNPDDYDCLILDEAHQALGKETGKAVEQLNAGIKLGFTATPDFSEKKRVKHLLGAEIHRMSIREGVESGHLSSFANLLVRTDADMSKVTVQGDDFDEKQLAEALDTAPRNEMALRIYQERFKDKHGIAYCVSVGHARRVAALFRRSGISAEAIDGHMNDDARRSILARYEHGETTMLCNADLLVEGFDEPRASVCFNLRPIRSGVVAEQRGGRVMRLDKADPDKLAYIFDFIDKGIDESGIVTFAKVAGGSFVANSPSIQRERRKRRKKIYLDFKIEGLDIVVEEDEIMRVQKKMDIPENKAGRIPESALQELEAAYQRWKLLPDDEGTKFNSLWLRKNDYGGLYEWAKKHGGISVLVAKASSELQADFAKEEQKDRTPESALQELEAGYQRWKGSQKEEKEWFNVTWLLKNGYRGLYRWSGKHGGISVLVAKASSELQADFAKEEQKDRTPESALQELEAAYQRWKLLPDDERTKFNPIWLRKNDYGGLYGWAKLHGGISVLVAKASSELQADFVKEEQKDRTPESALQELEEAYLVWKALPEETRRKFTSKWLEKNGYSGLEGWASRHGGLQPLVAKASPDLQGDFEKRG